MTGDLVSVSNGHLAFGDIVSRVTDSLSPLGAAARILAESSACVIAMREINLAGRQATAENDLKLAMLTNRRTEASGALRAMRTRVGQAELNASGLRKSIANMQREIVRPSISLDEKKVYLELIRVLTNGLVDQHASHGDELVGTIDSVLNGSGAPALAPASSVDTGRRRTTGARGRRSRG